MSQEVIHVYTLGNRQPTIVWQECSRSNGFKTDGDGNCLFRSLAHIVYSTELGHLQMRKLLVVFVKSNRQMFEPLIIPRTFDEHIDRMACARVWGSHIELQAAVSLFEMPVFLCTCTTSQSGHEGYKWNFYKPFPPGKLVHPPHQELSHIELCHTGGCHFDCVLSNNLKFSLNQWLNQNYMSNIYITTLLYNTNWGRAWASPTLTSSTWAVSIYMLSLLFCMSYGKSPPALILHVLASFVNSKTIHKLLRIKKDTNRRTSLMAAARTETTHGPTYSMTRAIWATPWQKGFICRCHCLRCHYSPLTVEAEVTHHMDRPLQ